MTNLQKLISTLLERRKLTPADRELIRQMREDRNG